MIKVAITFVIWGMFVGGTARAGTIYLNALPNIFLNQPAGALRSNISFTESDPVDEFDGTTVVLSQADLGGSSAIISSITTWSVASLLGDPLGNEFTSVSLYFRPQGGTWQILETGAPDQFFDSGDPTLVRNSNPDITHTNIPYNVSDPNYQSTGNPDNFFPLWQNMFSNLNLQLQAGVPYEFAVWGTNPNADPDTLYGFWSNHYSNAFLSGAREDNKSGSYLRCDATQLSAPCFVEDPLADGVWDKGANMNIEIDSATSTTTPEPSSFLMSCSALLGVLFLLRKRPKVRGGQF